MVMMGLSNRWPPPFTGVILVVVPQKADPETRIGYSLYGRLFQKCSKGKGGKHKDCLSEQVSTEGNWAQPQLSPSARLDGIHLRITPLKEKEAGLFLLQVLALTGHG